MYEFAHSLTEQERRGDAQKVTCKQIQTDPRESEFSRCIIRLREAHPLHANDVDTHEFAFPPAAVKIKISSYIVQNQKKMIVILETCTKRPAINQNPELGGTFLREEQV
jgi:hypothetical protein